MEELLTVKEVQDRLKIDRITVYRMLKDGRLTGVKIGHQWRFSRQEIDALFSSPRLVHGGSSNGHATPASPPQQALPLHCVQLIQGVFAEVAQVGAITTDPDGQPLTEINSTCRFCDLVMWSEQGYQGCVASWRRLSKQSTRRPEFATCHAGLQYARARIDLNDEPVALIVAGQFYTDEPDPEEVETRIRRLAEKYGLDPDELLQAAKEIQVLDGRKRGQIGDWLESVAHTFESITRERVELMSRLRTIAAMSTLEG